MNSAAINVFVALLASTALAETRCEQDLCTAIRSGQCAGLKHPDFSDVQHAVESVYQVAAYTPRWIDSGGALTPQGRTILNIVQSARNKGLNPDDYDLSAFDAAREPLRFDVALTIGVCRYASDVRFGRTRSQVLRRNRSGQDQEFAGVLQRLATSLDPRKELDSLEPPFDGYRRCLTALQKYSTLAKSSADVKFTPGRKVIQPGDSLDSNSDLIAILKREGDLPQATGVTQDRLYTGALVSAVKRFQERHGLAPDGRIGATTLAQLNTPLAWRVRQLEMALERWRWWPRRFSSPPIVVNLPEFRLRAMNASFGAELEMKIVVGQADKHQTPLMAGAMTEIIFRPYWNVPLSIQRDEIVPALQRDRAYLAKNGFEIAGQPNPGGVDAETVARLRSGAAALRQRPGPNNSLGLIVFIFPNDRQVYLHSTSAPYLFARSRRDLSHGCMRVEKPEALVNWVLHDRPGWSAKRIQDTLNGADTVEVLLMKSVPVLVTYSTAVVLENGEVRFFEDIYSQDGALDQLMAN